jgi:hypothetical protein
MTPVVVAIEMGYGHLRAAQPLAERLGTAVLECDREPLAGPDEQEEWARARRFYELASRVSQLPAVGGPIRSLLDGITHIPPLHPLRDLSTPTLAARLLHRYAGRGLGRGLTVRLRRDGAPLLTTFFAPALTANAHGCDALYCVVTDSDINRVWAPLEPTRGRVRYFAPSLRVVQRLRAYGVPPHHVIYSGFPLPHALLGGPDLPTLRANLARRLARLDPHRSFRDHYRNELQHFLGPLPDEERRPPRVTFAVGGAGAQVGLARQFLPGLAGSLRAGALRLCLVAGTRGEVAAAFDEALAQAGLAEEVGRSVEILHERTLRGYLARFDTLLAETDVLWTKPSELTFYGALGLPLVFCPPIGVHEAYNRRWSIEQGAGLKQRDPRFAAGWLHEWIADGTLAGAAWNGFMRLPKFGLYRILEEVAKG